MAVVVVIIATFADVIFWIGALFSGQDSDDRTRVPTWLGFTLWSIAVVGLVATVTVVATAG